MINRTKVKESTQIKPGDNGDVLVMKDNAPEWSTPSDADLAKVSETDTKLAEKQDKLVAGDNIHIVGNTISADGEPTPIAIGTVTSGEVPMVSNSGTDTDVVLNFVLPKGEKGDPGKDGTQVNNIAPLTVETAPTAKSGYSVAIGSGAVSSSSSGAAQGVAIGKNSYAGINGGIVIGQEARIDDNNGGGVVIGNYAFGKSGVNIGSHMQTRPTSMPTYSDTIGNWAEAPRGNSSEDDYSVALGSFSRATEGKTVSVGSGVAALTLSDDMTEEQKVVARAASDVATRRIVNVTDPQNAQDAATKNYVDTQLTPINAKLQYVPENTNQILSQIQTNVEKAQSAADAKVASITPGTGITVDASNPTAPVVSTTGLATQASVDTLTTTVNSKANQTDLDSLEGTVAGKADTSALANYATKTELAAKADQTAVDSLTGTVNSKVSSVTAGEGISITGTATEPVISVSGGTTDTGWLEITGSSGSGLKYLTGPWTIPAGAKVKIRKFGKRVTAVGVVQATEDISSGAATSLLSIPESDPHFDAFSLPQVSQYDIAHDQQKCAATSVLLIRGMLTSFNVEQNLDTPKINVTLVPVVGVAGQTAQIGNGDTVNFQISWDTED